MIELLINEAMPLDEEGAIYLIEEGAVNLFGLKEGRRHFIGHFGKGEIVFYLPPIENELSFSLFAEKTTRIRKLTLEQIQDKKLIKSWDEKLTKSLELPHTEKMEAPFPELFNKKLKSDEEEAKIRLKKKKEDEEDLLHEIKYKMEELLEPEAPYALRKESADLLFQSFKIVAKELGVEADLPKTSLSTETIEDELEQFCKFNEMRKRQATLPKDFYKTASTHFLAFRKESLEPLALLYQGQGRYFIINPKTGEKSPLSNPDEIDPIAYVFYPPLPKGVVKGKEMLRFFFKKKKKELLPLLFYGLVATLISLAVPIATFLFFKMAIPNADYTLVTQIIIGLLFAALTSSSFFFFQSVLIARVKGIASNVIDLGLWDQLLKLPTSFFRNYTSGNLSSRMLSAERIRQIFTDDAAKVLLSGVFSIGYLVMMAIFSFQLTLIALLILSIALLITWLSCRRLITLEKNILDISSIQNGFLVQIIRGVAKLRLSQAENFAFAQWGRLFIKTKRLEIKAQNKRNTVYNLNSILPFLTYAALFSYVFLLEKRAEITIPTFLAFNSAFLTFLYAFTDMTRTLVQVVKLGPIWERCAPILIEKKEITKEHLPIKNLTGDVHLDEISFRYQKDSPLVLDNFSLKVKPGESVAIVGPSGSGKSTLVRLMLSLEQPDGGAIYFDNKDLDLLDVHDVRRNIGVVMQSEGMISGTLFENLVRGSFHSKEAILRALSLSCFEKDLAEFPMGLHTYIPMNGETLSGGQKQRLLLARALLPQPNILIFDEATSALDNHTQEIVSKNIEALNITRILIAHRLSTIKGVDRIYVLDQGKCIQQGTYQELSRAPGLFATMLERQKL